MDDKKSHRHGHHTCPHPRDSDLDFALGNLDQDLDANKDTEVQAENTSIGNCPYMEGWARGTRQRRTRECINVSKNCERTTHSGHLSRGPYYKLS